MQNRKDWFNDLGCLGTAALRCLPPETAHNIGMKLAQSWMMRALPDPYFSREFDLSSVLPGVGRLKTPLGLAAGFDKNAIAMDGFVKLGFGFLEIGTVTPKPQPGNPKPRMFRLSGQRAIVNRMGFNSDGVHAVKRRLEKLRWSQHHPYIGINLGKNKETGRDLAAQDFFRVAKELQQFANYFVINISSPNTPGLRDLASPEFIAELSDVFGELRAKTWVKLDPDLDRSEFQELVNASQSSGFAGLILSNTHKVNTPYAGGLSGHPLLTQSNALLEWAYEVHQGTFPMIASGGVLSGIDAFHKIARGACAVQLYSALVYRGPGAVASIHNELADELRRRGFASLMDAKGSWYRHKK